MSPTYRLDAVDFFQSQARGGGCNESPFCLVSGATRVTATHHPLHSSLKHIFCQAIAGTPTRGPSLVGSGSPEHGGTLP